MAIEKIKILGAVLELPAKQHCQSSPFTSKNGPNGLNWQFLFSWQLQKGPRILIFSIAMGAKPLFKLKSIAIWAPTFFMNNNSFIATVSKSKCTVNMRIFQKQVYRKNLALQNSANELTFYCKGIVVIQSWKHKIYNLISLYVDCVKC